MIRSKKLSRIGICFLTFLIALTFSNYPCLTSEANEESSRVIVSMGDSYSSGEGIDDFYDSDMELSRKVYSEDWAAHRSENSWGGQLTLPGVDGEMARHQGENWYFVAASGATTEHITGTQSKYCYKKKDSQEEATDTIAQTETDATGEEYVPSAYINTVMLPAQTDVFDQLADEGKKADYVTLTLGGNDAGFSDVISNAALGSTYLNFSSLADTLQNTWNNFYKSGGIRDNLRSAYNSIADNAGSQAKIIVAGYPKLLDQDGRGKLFSKEEATMINESVTAFNKEIENLTTSCKASGMKIYFVSVEEKFNGHEAYSKNSYINKISIFPKEQDINDKKKPSDYSIHPDANGAEIYRECVQDKIDELEEDGDEAEWTVRTTSDERDIVLVLDTSGSMSGTPIEETKKAASNFISTILQEDASIGIVTYDSSASMLSDFSVDEEYLEEIADNITDGGGTNIEDGLKKAEEMLSESNAEKKIIVLMSDGQPNNGKIGDELVSYADSIKEDGTYIYTLGFFENMGSDKSSAQTLMEQIASDGCHYEVADADDLVFFFGDIADQINGQKYIYVRIACPVDVNVTYNGETLSSDADDENVRTSFGSLTFEENDEDASEDSEDDRIKILRLKDGTDYDVEISGNGKGEMNYTIGFMDDTGEYNDLRKFKNIEITKRTQIDTVASNCASTVLKVDSDGDGKYDLKYKATANGIGEIVDYTYIYYIVFSVLILIVLLIMYIKIKKWKRQLSEKKMQKQAAKKVFCIYCGNEMPGDKKFCSKCGKRL